MDSNRAANLQGARCEWDCFLCVSVCVWSPGLDCVMGFFYCERGGKVVVTLMKNSQDVVFSIFPTLERVCEEAAGDGAHVPTRSA